MSAHFHLFVYGTLRSNGAAASLLADCELIGNASVGGVLYDIDGVHPAMVLYGSTRSTIGRTGSGSDRSCGPPPGVPSTPKRLAKTCS